MPRGVVVAVLATRNSPMVAVPLISTAVGKLNVHVPLVVIVQVPDAVI